MEPIAKSGELILYADANRRTGVLYDSIRGTVSDRESLQVFFKWGNFVALTDTEKEEMESQ